MFNVFSLVPPVSPVTFSRPGDNINHLRRYPISKYDRQWYLNHINHDKNTSMYENIKRIDNNEIDNDEFIEKFIKKTIILRTTMKTNPIMHRYHYPVIFELS